MPLKPDADGGLGRLDARIVGRITSAAPRTLTPLERVVRWAALCGSAYRTTAQPLRALVWLGVAAVARALAGT